MASRIITTAIRDLFGTIDLQHVQEELAKELCRKITALSFLPLTEWIEISSMDLPTLRDTLIMYKQNNDDNSALVEKEGEDDPQDMTYKDAMILDDEFDVAHLYYASILTLRQMANEVIKAYSFIVDTSKITSMTRPQLICKIYEFLYLVLEQQGLAKGGVIVCPTIDEEEKSISPLQTNLNTTKKQRVHSPANSTTNLDIEKKLKKMLALTIEEIKKINVTTARPMITAFTSKYNKSLDTNFFTSPIAIVRDQLLVYTIELHTYFSASILHESIPESFILDLPVIQTYN